MTEVQMVGIAVMRACPLHLGHQAVIDQMIGIHGLANTRVILGSCNAPLSMRHLFSFADRMELMETKYPGLLITGIPDFADDTKWMHFLEVLLRFASLNLSRLIFYGGCTEDIDWLPGHYHRKVVNRFDGKASPPISATEVRDALIEGRSLEELVDPLLWGRVLEMHKAAWQQFKKM